MPRKRFSTEQIITKLRQAEVELSRGLRAPQVCKKLGVSEQTYDRWRKEYGGLRLDQAKRLKTLEQENARLKQLVADQALDNLILKEVEERRDPSIAIPSILRRQLDESRDQAGLSVGHASSMPVRRPRLPQDSTDPPFRDAQVVSDMVHRLAASGRAQNVPEAAGGRLASESQARGTALAT